MVRVQVQLTEEQAERLRRISRERGLSIAALIREALEAATSRPAHDERVRRALAAVDRATPGDSPDVSEGHDRYLDAAFLP